MSCFHILPFLIAVLGFGLESLIWAWHRTSQRRKGETDMNIYNIVLFLPDPTLAHCSGAFHAMLHLRKGGMAS